LVREKVTPSASSARANADGSRSAQNKSINRHGNSRIGTSKWTSLAYAPAESRFQTDFRTPPLG